MTDTIKRLCGPTRPAQTEAGTLLYTAGGSTVTAVKSALLHNTDPLFGAFFTMAIGSDLSVATGLDDRVLSSYYVAPGDTAYVPLDLVLGNNETLYARQSCMVEPTEMVIATAVANITAASATTIATASWAEANNDMFVMTIWAASGSVTISSFTDTHTGVTWTLRGGPYLNTAGDQQMWVYTAQSSGTTNTTTTVTFSGATVSAVSITKITALTSAREDTTGTHGSTGFRVLGGAAAPSGTTPLLMASDMGAAVGYTIVHSTVSEGHAAMTGWTELSDVTANASIASAYMRAPASWVRPTITTGTTAYLGAFVEFLNSKRSINVVLNGVEVT